MSNGPRRVRGGRRLVRGRASLLGCRSGYPRAASDRFEEQLPCSTAVAHVAGETFSYDGVLLARGIRRRCPAGAVAPSADHHRRPRAGRRTRSCRRYADEFNVPFSSVEENRRGVAGCGGRRTGASCATRPPRRSRSTRRRRGGSPGRRDRPGPRRPARGWPGRPLRRRCGQARQLRDARASRVYLQVLDLSDLDHLELIASQVAPQVARCSSGFGRRAV